MRQVYYNLASKTKKPGDLPGSWVCNSLFLVPASVQLLVGRSSLAADTSFLRRASVSFGQARREWRRGSCSDPITYGFLADTKIQPGLELSSIEIST